MKAQKRTHLSVRVTDNEMEKVRDLQRLQADVCNPSELIRRLIDWAHAFFVKGESKQKLLGKPK